MLCLSLKIKILLIQKQSLQFCCRLPNGYHYVSYSRLASWLQLLQVTVEVYGKFLSITYSKGIILKQLLTIIKTYILLDERSLASLYKLTNSSLYFTHTHTHTHPPPPVNANTHKHAPWSQNQNHIKNVSQCLVIDLDSRGILPKLR